MINKEDLLEKHLNGIEEKYKHIFINHPNLQDANDEHDRIKNHYFIFNNNGSFIFSFREETWIPKYIQDECIDLFKSIMTAPSE